MNDEAYPLRYAEKPVMLLLYIKLFVGSMF